jgi:hypothetical protein
MSKFQSLDKSVFRVLALSAVLLTTGCRGPWSKDWKMADMFKAPWGEEEDAPVAPRRIVGTWTDAVLHQGTGKPQRGFGGRLIFYSDDTEKPVLVEGQVVVYAFDETNREATDNKPTRRYVFPADQVARRMSKSELGPSYSFWLPWDEVGGSQTEISLVARFEPTEGPIVVGEQTKHLLPGEAAPKTGIVNHSPPKLPEGIPSRPATPTLAELAAQAQAGANQVQLASFEAPLDPTQPVSPPQFFSTAQIPVTQQSDPSAQPERRMTTTSISLPENFRVNSTAPPQTTSTREIEMANNRFAMPQGSPANYASVAAPISTQQPGFNNVPVGVRPLGQLPQVPVGYPTFMTPPQSGMGGGFVAPLGPPQATLQPVPTSVGQINAPPAAPMMQGQPPLTTAAGWPTASYPPGAVPAGSAVPVGQQSFGYQPTSPQVLAAPVAR